MVSFKGRLVIITISKNKRAISKREETKMDITQPPDTDIGVKYVYGWQKKVLSAYCHFK